MWPPNLGEPHSNNLAPLLLIDNASYCALWTASLALGQAHSHGPATNGLTRHFRDAARTSSYEPPYIMCVPQHLLTWGLAFSLLLMPQAQLKLPV